MSSSDMGMVFAILAAYIGVMLVIMAIVYVVSSLGFFKLYKGTVKWSDKAWMAWVPIANLLILAWFLADENNSSDWEKWFMSLYWLAGIIPIVGGIVSFVGAIFVIINYFKFMGKYSAPTWHYVMIFVFPLILPWLWRGYFNDSIVREDTQHSGRRTYQ